MKKTLASLVAFILSLSLLLGSLQAADSLRMTNEPSENFTITADTQSIVLRDLPQSFAFQTVCIVVRDAAGNEHIVEFVSRAADGTATISIASLPDGTYWLELYTDKDGGTFGSYFFGDDVTFTVKDKQADFNTSPVLAANRAVYASKRSDKAALAYYTKPDRYAQSGDAQIIALSKTITSGLATEYEKARAIHDWVCTNIWYDMDAVNANKLPPEDALYTLKTGRAVCVGFASLTAALMRAAGIPCKMIDGFGLNPGYAGGWTAQRLKETNHTWNEAYVDGRWIFIDATWNTFNKYENGQKENYGGLAYYRYFDATLEAFSLDHRMDDYSEAAIPAINAVPAAATVYVNGEAMTFDAYYIDNNNYFKLRDLAYVLNGTSKSFEVFWNAQTGAIELTSHAPYTIAGTEMRPRNNAASITPKPAASLILLDGAETRFAAYTIGGNTYFKLHNVGAAFDFNVTWDGARGAVLIDTTRGYGQ